MTTASTPTSTTSSTTSLSRSRSRTLVRLRGVDLDTPTGRPLVRGLHASLASGDHVALIGRNGVGKSTLLRLICGRVEPLRGRVELGTRARLVPQHLDPEQTGARIRELRRYAADPALAAHLAELRLESLDALVDRSARLSGGERRKLHLLAARMAGPELVVLDEPTQDLDAAAQRWLAEWLGAWPGAVLVTSHSRRLLRGFEHFFELAEAGCRYRPGSFEALERQLSADEARDQRRYAEELNTLDQLERRNVAICRRRQRKKNVGRIHELRRRTSRARLNEKRSYAQESQARAAKIRTERIGAARSWAKAARRALQVQLPLAALTVALEPHTGDPLIRLRGVGVSFEGQAGSDGGSRELFAGLDLDLSRERVAITGPNGAGKTTLLRVLLGQLAPTTGTLTRRADRADRIASIDQGARAWASDASLLDHLLDHAHLPDSGLGSLEQAAALLVAHRFPLALASRPLASLSPGERVRAALICLVRRRPAVELLILDEPTSSLDFVGVAALEAALAAWPGGLVLVSHDEDLLEAVGVDTRIELG